MTETDDPRILIVRFIEQSRILDHNRVLEKRIEDPENENAELLSVITGAPHNPVGPLFLAKPIKRGQDVRVDLTQEKEEVDALQNEVVRLGMTVNALEKRIGLMRQKRSQYSEYFTRNPKVISRVGDQIADLLKRYAEQDVGGGKSHSL
jgi:hypothetical protein